MLLGFLRRAGVITGIVLLGACQPSVQQRLDDYASRLGNVLKHSPPKVALPPPLQLPTRQRYQAEEVNINLRDFYALRDCRLYSLVAERNTALGKLQGLSQRYIYEQRLLDALDECRQGPLNAELSAKLQQWQSSKQQALVPLWSALLDDSELRSSLAGNRQQQAPEEGMLDSSRTALDYLLAVAPYADGQQSQQLESHLQALHQGQLPARWYQTRRIFTAYLNALNPWLEAQNVRCQTETAQYLSNVFGLFFIQNIQPLAGQLNHYQYELAPRLTKLYDAGPRSIQYWLAERDVEHQAFSSALQTHVTWWQKLFKQCQLPLPTATQRG